MSTLTLGSQLASLKAKRALDLATLSSQKATERLSSGSRINRASDDAAGLAIASTLASSIRVYSQGIRNLNDGLSFLSIGDSTIDNLSDVVIRIRELTEQSANGSFSNRQRLALDREAQELAREFFRVSRSAQFNGLRLFDGTLSSGLRLQAGYGDNGGIQSSLGGALGSGAFNRLRQEAVDGVAFGNVVLKDINADGNIDMVSAGNSGTGGYVSVRLGVGNGTFGAATSYIAEEGGESSDIALGDINNDGVLDLVSTGYYSYDDGMTVTQAGNATVRLGNGDGTFGSSTSYYAGSRRIILADVNGDDHLDMLTAGLGDSGGEIIVRLGTGTGAFSDAVTQLFSASSQNGLTLGDVNRDGIQDLLSSGDSSTWVSLGNGNGTFRAAVSYSAATTNTGTTHLVDLNADGNLDMVMSGYTGSNVGYATIRLGNGNGTFRGITSYSTTSGIALGSSVEDVNGDGILDLLVSGQSDTGNGEIVIRLGLRDGSFAAAVSYLSDTSASHGLALNDLNGDGVLDIVTVGQNGGSSSEAVLFGITREGLNPLLNFSLQTKSEALQAMAYLDRTLQRLSSQRGQIGALQSRLATALGTLQSTKENYTIAASRITDSDVAREAAELTRTQILQRTANAVMAQANQAPTLVLQLLNA